MDPFTPRGLFTDLVIWPFYSMDNNQPGQRIARHIDPQPSNIFVTRIELLLCLDFILLLHHNLGFD